MYQNVVILNLFQHPYHRRTTANKQPGFRLRRRAACRNDGGIQGFTLIELLVVVLIIGILSSVALPQYTKAVEKSRVAEALTLVRAIRDANEAYYMANGSYSSDLNNLDISIPGADGTYNNVPRKEIKSFSFAASASVSSVSEKVIAVGHRFPIQSRYLIFAVAGESSLRCKFYTASAEKYCKSFGGRKISSTVYSVN
ncbi:MAG: pilin [Elusimicrobiales bacterium]|nr:pilin [Elusimicrobiales bacterium]